MTWTILNLSLVWSYQSCWGVYCFHSVRPSVCLPYVIYFINQKEKEELSPFHISYWDFTNIILRHHKKRLQGSHISHGYEDSSMDTNHPIWRRQERQSKYVVQLASTQQRSNYLKMSICPSHMHCLLCNSYSSEWILTILGTNYY